MILYFIIIGAIILFIPELIEEQKAQVQFKRALSPGSITYKDFINNKGRIRRMYNVPGVYVITNTSKGNKKYVGQSVNIYSRVNSHFSGSGNGDIYHDLMSGDTFIVDLIKLKDTKFRTLDSLEKYLISYHDSYYNGYNKTRGNG